MLEGHAINCLFLNLADIKDLKLFAKAQGAPEADDLNHWDTSFWSERLRESKYEINEVRLSRSHHLHPWIFRNFFLIFISFWFYFYIIFIFFKYVSSCFNFINISIGFCLRIILCILSVPNTVVHYNVQGGELLNMTSLKVLDLLYIFMLEEGPHIIFEWAFWLGACSSICS